MTARRHRLGWTVGLLACALVCAPGWATGREADVPTEEDAQDEEGLDDEGFTLDEEFALLEEEAIVFSASKRQQRISESPATITVITRRQIEDTHCLDVACLMRQVPEIEVRDIRPLYQSVGARAMTGELGDKGIVLVDGWEINVDAIGIPFWGALPVHLEDIERIEVVRGPGSALYGANAHSMVISITTRKPEGSGASIFVGAGEHNTNQVHTRLFKQVDGWWFEASGGVETAAHWRVPHTRDREVARGRIRVVRDWGDQQTSLAAGVVAADGTIYTELAPAQLDNSYLAHGILTHRGDSFQVRLWGSVFRSDLHFDLPLIYEGISLGTWPDVLDVLSSALDFDANLHHSFFEGNDLLVGVNYRWLTYVSKANQPDHINQHRAGVYLHDEQKLWDQLFISAGVRFDYNSLTPFTISPRGAVVWKFLPDHLLRVSAGQAFQKPTFFNTSAHIVGVEPSGVAPNLDEFFLNSIGNEDVGNEKLTAVELGYRGSLADGGLVLEFNGFFHLAEDPINFIFDLKYNNLGFPDLRPEEGSQLRFQNEDFDLHTFGGSVALTWHPLPALRLAANYTYRRTIYHGQLPDRLRLDAGGEHQHHGEPAHLGSFTATYTAAWGLRTGLTVNLRGPYQQFWVADGGLFGDQMVLKIDWAVVPSAYLAWRVDVLAGWVEAGLRAIDLTNHGYRETTSVIRFDGREMGGQLLGRKVFFYLRGSI